MFSNAKIFKRIEKEVFFLSKLYAAEFIFFLVINIILLKTLNSHHTLSFFSYDIFIFLGSIAFGLVLSSFLHNCSHENTGGKYLNYIIGEFCGAWVMYGYRNFVLIHILHHKYTDDHLDPVNPDGMTFLKFLSAPMRYMIKRARNFLEIRHSDHKHYKLAKNIHERLFHLNLLLRLAFWFLVFGPKYFIIFYIPSVIANIFIFAHINYSCHRNDNSGEVEVVNMNHNLYFKIANFLTMGGYFHKNHHINQKLFNPTNLKTKRAHEKFISKKGCDQSSFYKVIPEQKRSIYNYLAIDSIWGEADKKTIKEKLTNFFPFFKTHP